YNKGNKLTIDYADGRKVEYTCKYDEDEGDYAFVSEDGEALYRWGDNEVSFNTNQYVKHWTLGEDNYLTIAYKGRECPVKVAVVESSVESFEFEPAKPIQLINNTGGEMDYNDETGEEYYLYWDFDPFVEGSKLIVHYKDGTTKIFNHQYDEDDFSCYVTEDGKDTIPVFSYGGVWYYDNQASDHWLMDKDNYLMISYQGMDYPIPVEIIESSVQSIEFEPGTDLYVYENGEGYYDNEFEQFIYDEPYPFTEGSKLIVHYKDDTSKTYFYQHDEKTKEDSYVSEDGDVIPADSSYGIWYEADQNSAPWSLGSDNYMNIHYLDVSCPVQVEVKKNLVDSISYESAVDVVFTEGKNIWSYQEEGERYFEEYNYAPSAGDRLTVNYIDESQETFTYVENKGFVNDKDAGNVLRESNFRYRPDQSEKLWAYGTGNDFMITYLGKSTTIQVTYKERETEPSEDEKAVAKVKALIEKANETFDSSAKAYEAVNAAQAALNALSKEQRAL
ncbi:MAG: hypothetical protein IJH60_04585, partial [Eubacterium sp.]|nr:hypothetical protein [Eubacterium sp.]